jgi:hypothetical protein
VVLQKKLGLDHAHAWVLDDDLEDDKAIGHLGWGKGCGLDD